MVMELARSPGRHIYKDSWVICVVFLSDNPSLFGNLFVLISRVPNQLGPLFGYFQLCFSLVVVCTARIFTVEVPGVAAETCFGPTKCCFLGLWTGASTGLGILLFWVELHGRVRKRAPDRTGPGSR